MNPEQNGPAPVETGMSQEESDRIFEESLEAMGQIGFDEARRIAADPEGSARISRQERAAYAEIAAASAAKNGDQEAYQSAINELNKIFEESQKAKGLKPEIQ